MDRCGACANAEEPPYSRVGGVILAAGLSRRFGTNKLLAPFLAKPLVRWVVEAALDSRLRVVAVVLGHEQEEIHAALADLEADARLIFVRNDRYLQGQSSSVIAGLSAVESKVRAVMFLPGDQPRLDSAVINRIITAFEQGGHDICHPVVAGRPCSPAIFGARHFPALRALRGDRGGRAVIDANPGSVATLPFLDDTPFRDVDLVGDLAALLRPLASPTDLTSALGLEGARHIAICGAGGKTSLMAALARELSGCGERVLATTTTKMATEEACAPWRAHRIAEMNDLLAGADDDPAPVLAYGAIDSARGRLIGLPPEMIDAVAGAHRFSRIIVEADGAARRPLKAPGPHEPVFPRTTDAVVMVAGASGLGQPLDERTVFRADLWSRLTGLRLGEPVTPDSLARMVVHPEGLAKGAPEQARKMLFINQADTAERLAAAELVLDRALGSNDLVPERGVVGCLQPAPAVRLITRRGRC